MRLTASPDSAEFDCTNQTITIQVQATPRKEGDTIAADAYIDIKASPKVVIASVNGTAVNATDYRIGPPISGDVYSVVLALEPGARGAATGSTVFKSNYSNAAPVNLKINDCATTSPTPVTPTATATAESLTVEKTANVSQIGPDDAGKIVTYNILVRRSGEMSQNAQIRLQDALSNCDFAEVIDVTAEQSGTVGEVIYSDNRCTVTILGNAKPGGNRFHIKVRIKQTANPPTSLTNQVDATVTDQGKSVSASDQVSIPVQGFGQGELSVRKIADSRSIPRSIFRQGGHVTYNILVRRDGGMPAATVKVIDTLQTACPSVLQIEEVTSNNVGYTTQVGDCSVTIVGDAKAGVGNVFHVKVRINPTTTITDTPAVIVNGVTVESEGRTVSDVSEVTVVDQVPTTDGGGGGGGDQPAAPSQPQPGVPPVVPPVDVPPVGVPPVVPPVGVPPVGVPPVGVPPVGVPPADDSATGAPGVPAGVGTGIVPGAGADAGGGATGSVGALPADVDPIAVVGGIATLPQGGTVTAGSPVTIGGQPAQIVSLPEGAVLGTSQDRLILPAGAVVTVGGQQVTLSEPTEVILGVSVVRAPVGAAAPAAVEAQAVEAQQVSQAQAVQAQAGVTLPRAGAPVGFGGAAILAGLALAALGGLLRRREGNLE